MAKLYETRFFIRIMTHGELGLSTAAVLRQRECWLGCKTYLETPDWQIYEYHTDTQAYEFQGSLDAASVLI